MARPWVVVSVALAAVAVGASLVTRHLMPAPAPLPAPSPHAAPHRIFDRLFDSEEAATDVVRLARQFGLDHGYGMYATETSAATDAWGVPERFDVGQNFFSTGGRLARREPYSSMLARITYFRETFATGERPDRANEANATDSSRAKAARSTSRAPGVDALLDLDRFADAAKALFVDESDPEAIEAASVHPVIVYANVMVPGMELGVHIDVPAFRGLDRRRTPQWLLAALHSSGLFERWRLKTATGVSWWSHAGGGKFVFYPHGPAGPVQVHSTAFGSSVVVDTDTVYHGVDRVATPEGAPEQMPSLSPGMKLQLSPGDADVEASAGGEVRVGPLPTRGEQWQVIDLDGRTVVANYSWSDVRLSISWKAFVFANDQERELWTTHTDDLDGDTALAMLVEDMVARGRVPACTEPKPSVWLARRIAAEYLVFPPPTTPRFPSGNYCMLPGLNLLCGSSTVLDFPPLVDPLSALPKAAARLSGST